MTEEEINKLAIKKYPIRIVTITHTNSKSTFDANELDRNLYIDSLKKKSSELLYSEEQMKDMWYDGWKSIAENQKEAEADIKAFLQSLKQQV